MLRYHNLFRALILRRKSSKCWICRHLASHGLSWTSPWFSKSFTLRVQIWGVLLISEVHSSWPQSCWDPVCLKHLDFGASSQASWTLGQWCRQGWSHQPSMEIGYHKLCLKRCSSRLGNQKLASSPFWHLYPLSWCKCFGILLTALRIS